MTRSFIDVSNFLPDFLQEFSQGFPNIPRNFGQYIQQLIFSETQDGASEQRNSSGKYGQTVFTCKQGPPHVKPLITIDDFVPYFVEESTQRFQRVDTNFAKFLIHLLIRDINDGLNLDENQRSLGVCRIEQFIERCLKKYANPLDATICNMKMRYYFKSCYELNLDHVKGKYEMISKQKLSDLIRSILQYPESSNIRQLEEMFIKMQLFIITNYEIGCAQNQVLLKQTRQCLNSVLGKGDLQKYVLRKRYHRIEYLQRLGATVCGILLFNNFSGPNDSGTLRNIFADLEMAQRNTSESLEEGLKLTSLYIRKGTDVVKNSTEVNVAQQNIQLIRPITKLREINKFIIFFHLYKRNLEQIRPLFERVQHQIEDAQKKFNCVLVKIKETIEFRSAIESELIFPHFQYLSELWSSLVLCLNHLVEINKIVDHLEELVNENLTSHFSTIIDEVSTSSQQHCKYTMEKVFEELRTSTKGKEETLCINKNPFIGDYCALTMVVTKGLLVPSQFKTKSNEDSEMSFGFASTEFAKYSERKFVQFKEALNHVVFTNADLILLLQLDDDLLRQDYDLIKQSETKNRTSGTQTEVALGSNLSSINHSNVSWNIWDYHRETIRLANIRQKQSHSTQSAVSFGKKDSQTQAYNTFEHFVRQRN